MKMTYERPVMRAELFEASEYVAACGIGSTDSNTIGMSALKVGNGIWYSYGNPNNNNPFETNLTGNGNYQQYGSLVFGGATTAKLSLRGNDYYWTTKVGEQNYYLQYSSVYTDKWTGTDESVFLLYEEETSNNRLNSPLDNITTFPGSEADGDDEGDWWFEGLYDNAIMAVIFGNDTFSTYWSN